MAPAIRSAKALSCCVWRFEHPPESLRAFPPLSHRKRCGQGDAAITAGRPLLGCSGLVCASWVELFYKKSGLRSMGKDFSGF